MLFSLIVVLSFSLLLWFAYWSMTSTLQDQARIQIQAELSVLSSGAEEEGTTQLISEISERARLSSGGLQFYWLSDANGQKIAGNLRYIDRRTGWHIVPLGPHYDMSMLGGEPDDHELWYQGAILKDGTFLAVGKDAYQALATQESLIESFALAALLAFMVIAGLGVLASRGVLKQVDAINNTAMGIMNGNIKERVPIVGSSDELDRLAVNLNRLFDSNQSLLESLKQVTTSIAHDLRTPLSRLRQKLESAVSSKRDAKVYRQAIESTLTDADQILSAFSALLRVAQIESGARRASFRTFELSNLVVNVVDAYRAVVEDGGRTFSSEVQLGVLSFGDADLVLQMLANLLENAITHTPPGSQIGMCLRMEGTLPVIEVTDNGLGIPPEERGKVFERLYRLDRSRSTPGSGLGLALVAAVAELHGMQITLEDNMPGLRVRVICAPAQP